MYQSDSLLGLSIGSVVAIIILFYSLTDSVSLISISERKQFRTSPNLRCRQLDRWGLCFDRDLVTYDHVTGEHCDSHSVCSPLTRGARNGVHEPGKGGRTRNFVFSVTISICSREQPVIIGTARVCLSSLPMGSLHPTSGNYLSNWCPISLHTPVGPTYIVYFTSTVLLRIPT